MFYYFTLSLINSSGDSSEEKNNLPNIQEDNELSHLLLNNEQNYQNMDNNPYEENNEGEYERSRLINIYFSKREISFIFVIQLLLYIFLFLFYFENLVIYNFIQKNILISFLSICIILLLIVFSFIKFDYLSENIILNFIIVLVLNICMFIILYELSLLNEFKFILILLIYNVIILISLFIYYSFNPYQDNDYTFVFPFISFILLSIIIALIKALSISIIVIGKFFISSFTFCFLIWMQITLRYQGDDINVKFLPFLIVEMHMDIIIEIIIFYTFNGWTK